MQNKHLTFLTFDHFSISITVLQLIESEARGYGGLNMSISYVFPFCKNVLINTIKTSFRWGEVPVEERSYSDSTGQCASNSGNWNQAAV